MRKKDDKDNWMIRQSVIKIIDDLNFQSSDQRII